MKTRLLRSSIVLMMAIGLCVACTLPSSEAEAASDTDEISYSIENGKVVYDETWEEFLDSGVTIECNDDCGIIVEE